MYFLHNLVDEQDRVVIIIVMMDYNPIGHVRNIPTMQFFTGISRNTQSKSYMLSLTEGIWDF